MNTTDATNERKTRGLCPHRQDRHADANAGAMTFCPVMGLPDNVATRTHSIKLSSAARGGAFPAQFVRAVLEGYPTELQQRALDPFGINPATCAR
jgi:hypothetical protein